MKGTLRKTIKVACSVMCAIVTSFVVLNIFCSYYSNQPSQVKNPTGATDYTMRPSYSYSVAREGYSRGVVDESGFNNVFVESGGSVDILLMGASHMEGLQVLPEENTAYLLNESLSQSGSNGAFVYNIGASSHYLDKSLSNLNAALECYDPEDAVVIDATHLYFDRETLEHVLDGTLEPYYVRDDSGLISSLRSVPLLKTLYSQRALLTADNPGDVQEEDALADSTLSDDEWASLMLACLQKAKREAGDTPIVIFFHPRLEISAGGEVSIDAEDAHYSALFAQLCEESGIRYLDLSDAFLEAYEREKELPYGFANTTTGFGHLNATGHRICAEELYKLLSDMGAQ